MLYSQLVDPISQVPLYRRDLAQVKPDCRLRQKLIYSIHLIKERRFKS
jgi:hypothetical protein